MGVVVTQLETFPDTLKQPRWSVEAADDLYVFSFAFYGDERDPAYLRDRSIHFVAGEQQTLRLRDQGTHLPVFVGYTLSVAEDYSGQINPLRLGPLIDGEIQIHDWEVDSLFTGRIKGVNSHGVPTEVYFYARMP